MAGFRVGHSNQARLDDLSGILASACPETDRPSAPPTRPPSSCKPHPKAFYRRHAAHPSLDAPPMAYLPQIAIPCAFQAHCTHHSLNCEAHPQNATGACFLGGHKKPFTNINIWNLFRTYPQGFGQEVWIDCGFPVTAHQDQDNGSRR